MFVLSVNFVLCIFFLDRDFSGSCATRYHDPLSRVRVLPYALGKDQGGTLHMSSPISADVIELTLQKVSSGKYQSTREFTHDTEWILHNCIIYNGGREGGTTEVWLRGAM